MMRRMSGVVLIGALILIGAARYSSGGVAAQQTDPVALVAGCNNVTLTWPVGTPLATVAEGVTPASALLSIFRLDPMMGRFLGYAPGVPDFANDYRMVGTSLEPVFICISAAGTLNRPGVGGTAPASPAPSALPAPPPTPAPPPATAMPVQLSGQGQMATQSITLPAPVSVAMFSHSGSRNFIVTVFQGGQRDL